MVVSRRGASARAPRTQFTSVPDSQIVVGDWAARDVATTQPIKLAAIEGLYKTTRGAPEHILGWYTDQQVKYGISIPHLLSLLGWPRHARVP